MSKLTLVFQMTTNKTHCCHSILAQTLPRHSDRHLHKNKTLTKKRKEQRDRRHEKKLNCSRIKHDNHLIPKNIIWQPSMVNHQKKKMTVFWHSSTHSLVSLSHCHSPRQKKVIQKYELFTVILQYIQQRECEIQRYRVICNIILFLLCCYHFGTTVIAGKFYIFLSIFTRFVGRLSWATLIICVKRTRKTTERKKKSEQKKHTQATDQRGKKTKMV